MTLVFAQKKKTIISAVSDTGITEHGAQLQPEKNIPKICILTPDLAVGFAGSSELALRCFAGFDRMALTMPTQIIGHFLRFHIKYEQSVDFIVMIRNPVLRMVKIADGKEHSSHSHTAWIGDHDGFEQFQRYRNDQESRRITSELEVPLMLTNNESELSPESVTFNLIAAMRYVIIDPNLPHVFGHAVGMSNAGGGFEYRSYAFVLDERKLSLALPNTFMQRIDPELQELREYSASCFVTTAASPRQGIAFHFLRGKLTYIYFGDRGAPLSECRIARSMNAEEFMAMMQAEGCTDWSGQIASRLPPPQGYGIDPNRWTRTDRGEIVKPAGVRLKP
ncbi:MAG: hypothetical protein WCF20_09635 [Methylovirgula sp.]